MINRPLKVVVIPNQKRERERERERERAGLRGNESRKGTRGTVFSGGLSFFFNALMVPQKKNEYGERVDDEAGFIHRLDNSNESHCRWRL